MQPAPQGYRFHHVAPRGLLSDGWTGEEALTERTDVFHSSRWLTVQALDALPVDGE